MCQPPTNFGTGDLSSRRLKNASTKSLVGFIREQTAMNKSGPCEGIGLAKGCKSSSHLGAALDYDESTIRLAYDVEKGASVSRCTQGLTVFMVALKTR